MVLAVTGAAYLFKPQVERWEERAYHGLSQAGAVGPAAQAGAALAATPGARLVHLSPARAPRRCRDAASRHARGRHARCLRLAAGQAAGQCRSRTPHDRSDPPHPRPAAARPARQLAGRAGGKLGDRHDPHRALPVVAARGRFGGRRLAASRQRQAAVLARPARRNRLLGIGPRAGPAVHRPALGRCLGQRVQGAAHRAGLGGRCSRTGP